MCLLLHRRAGHSPTKDAYQNAFAANPDGVGMAYVEGRKLVVDKGYETFDAWWAAYEKLGDREMLVHFRKASPNMKIVKEMCHPFSFDTGKVFETEVDGVATPRYQFAVAHNGKLPWRFTDAQSDTCCFVEDLLHPALERDPYLLEFPYGIGMIEKIVTEKNKLAIMRYDVEDDAIEVFVINRNADVDGRKGHEKWGCWFSNESYVKGHHPYHVRHGAWDDFDNPSGMDEDGWSWDWLKGYWVNHKTNDARDFHLHRLRPINVQGTPGKLTGASNYTMETVIRLERLGNAVNIDVIPEIPAANVTPIDDVPSLSSTSHLSAFELGVIKRIALSYAESTLVPGTKPSLNEVIMLLRADVQLAFRAEVHGMAIARLDRWIIKKDLEQPTGGVGWLLDSGVTTS